MSFSENIINWFNENKRDLPWRRTDNPYHIWLSEIILQQTRVNQGLAYYYEFLRKYPQIKDLAAADEQDVLKTWQGLGYYSRARNLHATAKIIVEKYQGKFPGTYKDILSLKGIGKYTAAAIASFAFKLPYSVVDGNVYRFISRFFGIFTPIGSQTAHVEFEKLLDKLMDRNHPDLFNQAIMEFGALYCKPQNPNCESCIFKNDCFAFKYQKQKDLPIKKNKPQVRTRYFYYLALRVYTKNEIYSCLQKRSDNDIWKNLNEFPLIETTEELSETSLIKKIEQFLGDAGISQYKILPTQKHCKHQLTHQLLIVRFIEIETLNPPVCLHENSFMIPIKDIAKYPVPRLIDLYLHNELSDRLP